MDGTLATVTLFAGNFSPRNWAYCAGQLIAIRQNTALFSLLGTVYGGDGQTTFALPNLCGRLVVGQGQGAGLEEYVLGERTGSENNTLTLAQLPGHMHPATATVQQPVSTNGNDSDSPEHTYPAPSSVSIYTSVAGTGQIGGPINANATSGVAGNNQPINNMQPTLGLNYIICMYGVFPARG